MIKDPITADFASVNLLLFLYGMYPAVPITNSA